MTRRQHSHRHGGQTLLEISLILPVVLLLFEGIFSGAQVISDQQVGGQAVRAGVRLGAEIGNDHYSPGIPASGCQTAGDSHHSATNSDKDPCNVDDQILQATLVIGKYLIDVKRIDEVDIYQPCATLSSGCSADSKLCNPSAATPYGPYVAGDPLDQYLNVAGTFKLQGASGYTLDLRTQTHPNEAVIAVAVHYHFSPPVPMQIFAINNNLYSTECLAPLEVA